VLALTDGNPFFVIEVAHLLTATPSGASGARALPAVPPGVQELLRRRLEPLPAASRRALDAAAVMGREFELAPLARVLDTPPEAVLEALGPALALGVVRDVPGALQRYAFVHALMRETLYEGLTPVARIALHGAIAEALEATGAAADERLPALAHHAFEAAQGREPTKAIRYACEAGGRALHLLAFEEAARHFERALAAVAVTGNEAARLQALVGLGEALHGSGDPEGAERVFRDAIGVARRCGPAAFAETALRFSGARAELAILDVEVNGVLEEALGMLPPDPAPLRARLMARLAAGINLQPGSEQRRKALSDEATRMARGLDDPTTLGFVLARRLIGLLGPDHLEERVATTDEILAAGPASRTAELEALVFRVDDLAERGDRGGLDHALTVFEQKVRAAKQPFFRWTAVSIRAAMAILEGRFTDAEALANEAFALGQQVHTRTALLQFGQQLFMLRGWQARLAEAEPMVTMGVAETGIVPAWRCALAEFYGVAGREAEARREFEALAATGFVDLPRDTTWLTSAVLLASTCTRLRDARRAEQLYDLMRPFRGRIAIARPLVVLVNPIDDRLGMLATVLGRYDDAEEHFADALRLAERMRALPWQATIRREWAELHRRRAGRGDRERALALLDEAEAIARPIGMDLLLGWIAESRDALRRSEQARPAVLTLVPRAVGPAASPVARVGTLRRDGDVWTVVFDGRTTHVRDMVGLAHLVRLLGAPGREVHAAELAAAVSAGAEDAPAARAVSGDAGVLLDARARADYETRLRDAGAELAEARRLNDRGRSERLAEEMEFIAAELSRGFGLGGRTRRAGSTAERARVSVTRAIKYAVDRIAEHDAALAEHLRLAVRTGTFCAYEPPDRDRVAWTL
jgi:tetratricopeptide (TPR) repeat protein